MAAQRRSGIDEFVRDGRRIAPSQLNRVRQCPGNVLQLRSTVEADFDDKKNPPCFSPDVLPSSNGEPGRSASGHRHKLASERYLTGRCAYEQLTVTH